MLCFVSQDPSLLDNRRQINAVESPSSSELYSRSSDLVASTQDLLS
jgi:hypothetical protein